MSSTIPTLSKEATAEISQVLGGKDFIVIAISANGAKQQFLPAGVEITPNAAGKTPIDFVNISITPPSAAMAASSASGSANGLGGVMKTFGWCNIGGIWVPC